MANYFCLGLSNILLIFTGQSNSQKVILQASEILDAVLEDAESYSQIHLKQTSAWSQHLVPKATQQARVHNNQNSRCCFWNILILWVILIYPYFIYHRSLTAFTTE